jgi:DNA-binding response OmpR family regulator
MEMTSINALLPVTTCHLENIHSGEIISADEHKYFGRTQNAGWTTQVKHVDEAGNFRILLVAIEQRERKSICSALFRHLDFASTFLEANTGELALHIIDREVVDLIIFGNDLADIDSLEFLGRLNNKLGRSKLPVIAILNSGAENTGLNAMKLGAHAYLLKDAGEHHIKLLPILVSRIHTEHQELSDMRQAAMVKQTLVDSLPAVFYKLSLQGGRHDVHISPLVSELGLSADKWGNDAELHHRMCHEEDRPVVKKALEHSYKTGSEFQCEYRINTSGDRVSWFHDQAKVVMDKNGHPLFLQGVMIQGLMTGFTYLKSLETELAHYRSMFDKMVCERTERLNRRLAILESCNSNMNDNYLRMRQLYLDLCSKCPPLEVETAAAKAA